MRRQLSEASYSGCVARGDGLQSALAGAMASFTVSCTNVFGEPAKSASLAVQMDGPASLYPSIAAVSGTPGTYRLSCRLPLPHHLRPPSPLPPPSHQLAPAPQLLCFQVQLLEARKGRSDL